MRAGDKKRTATLEEAENQARRIGRLVGSQMPTGWGFLLLMAQLGGEGSMTYISNCHRSSIPTLCRELAYKLEGDPSPLDAKSNYDPHMDKALELLSLFAGVLSGGMYQVQMVGSSEFIRACGGEEGFKKLAGDTQKVLRSAIKQAEELVRRLKPELLDGGDVEFTKEETP